MLVISFLAQKRLLYHACILSQTTPKRNTLINLVKKKTASFETISVDPTGIAPAFVGFQPIVFLLHHGPIGVREILYKNKSPLQGLLF